MSGWVKSGDYRPWIAARESVHSTNFPDGRLPTVSSALQSARTSAVKSELKKFSQNVKPFPFKINAQPVNPFI
jgi:hypothetical protein